MKIVYFIFSSGKASGGHFHSCDQISRALGTNFDIKIISIGSSESPVLTKNPYFEEHISYNNILNALSLHKKLNLIKTKFNPDIIHCYDTEVMNILLPLPVFWNKNMVLTKCGGPNPIRRDWQYANSIINFSYENHTWFEENKNYKKVHLYHVANRVNSLNEVSEEIRTEKKDNEVFNFMRISRLGGAYEKTLLDTFNLIEELNKKFKIKLYVIGRIQDEDRFNFFKKEALTRNIPIHFITDERASKASNFLYLADCVIGTGRSFMEATSLSIPTLTPAANHNMPILVTKDNFGSFFRTNFSERNVASNDSISINFSLISELMKNVNFYDEKAAETQQLFLENFSLEKISPKYRTIYKETLSKKPISRLKLIFKNKLYLVKSIIKVN